MTSARFVTELTATVFDTTTKNRIDVREDGDGMDLIEVLYTEGESEPIIFPWIEPAMARELATNLIRVADHIEARKRE